MNEFWRVVDKWRHLLMVTYAAGVLRFAWHYLYHV
jgi:hypothetical protein